MRKKGFTLVELSIVLVIIGLIIGGVMTGQSLMRAAELRAVISEVEQYKTALRTFKDQYFYLPGDLPNAYDFWPSAGCTDTVATDASPGGCNGNADGYIAASSGGTRHVERFRGWQHLGLSEIIPGSFSGAKGPGTSSDALIGENCPASKLSGAGYSFESFPNYAGDSARYPKHYASVLKFGLDNNGGQTDKAALVPKEAWGIDKKIDDGLPGTGTVMTYRPTHALGVNCATDADPDVAEYQLDYVDLGCQMIFHTQ